MYQSTWAPPTFPIAPCVYKASSASVLCSDDQTTPFAVLFGEIIEEAVSMKGIATRPQSPGPDDMQGYYFRPPASPRRPIICLKFPPVQHFRLSIVLGRGHGSVPTIIPAHPHHHHNMRSIVGGTSPLAVGLPGSSGGWPQPEIILVCLLLLFPIRNTLYLKSFF